MPAISPLAPAGFPDLKPIAGVRLAAYAAGVRYAGRNDLMLAELAPGTTIARTEPSGRQARHQSTGAPGVFDCVSTPAIVVPGASSANITSLRPA